MKCRKWKKCGDIEDIAREELREQQPIKAQEREL
jgi:hypothetical protein